MQLFVICFVVCPRRLSSGVFSFSRYLMPLIDLNVKYLGYSYKLSVHLLKQKNK